MSILKYTNNTKTQKNIFSLSKASIKMCNDMLKSYSFYIFIFTVSYLHCGYVCSGRQKLDTLWYPKAAS